MERNHVNMANMAMEDLAERLRDIDFCMLTTRTDNGALASRPMSTNREVEYDGDSFFFTSDKTRMVADIQKDKQVSLAFTGEDGFFSAVEGKAELIKDKAAFEEHWTEELDEWFEDGADTPGLVLIKVSAERIQYWDGMDAGEVKV